jgi:predicted RNA-binding protein with PUA-like domain
MVDVEFVAKAKETVGLPEIKAEAALADMELVRYGRLSVQSVKREEFERVKRMAGL